MIQCKMHHATDSMLSNTECIDMLKQNMLVCFSTEHAAAVYNSTQDMLQHIISGGL